MKQEVIVQVEYNNNSWVSDWADVTFTGRWSIINTDGDSDLLVECNYTKNMHVCSKEQVPSFKWFPWLFKDTEITKDTKQEEVTSFIICHNNKWFVN